MPTLYATFEDAADAERAAGALFDHGIARSDLTITSKHQLRTSSISREDESALLSGENEGWPPRTAANLTADRIAVQAGEELAYARYEEADRAERSAKSGITITTPRDAAAGALKGSIIGLLLGVVVGLIRVSPAHFALVNTIAFGVGAGAVVGAATGSLKDQGMRRIGLTPPGGSAAAAESANSKAPGRPVLLAAHLASSKLIEAAARRLALKYRASSVDVS